MTIEHPRGGSIGPMLGKKGRFAHVIKHLYDRQERWDLAVPELPTDLNQCALASGCQRSDLRERRACAANGECVAHVLEDHDRYMQPAYEAALVNAIEQKRFGEYPYEGETQQAFVGRNGCYVRVGPNHAGQDHHVITAHRVRPRGMRSPPRLDGRFFYRAAVRKLSDATSYGEDGKG